MSGQPPTPRSGIRYRDRPARARCCACGSTRLRGIVEAYVDGPVVVDAEGHLSVPDGDAVIHEERAISPGSLLCLNCGHGEARVERARTETVLR